MGKSLRWLLRPRWSWSRFFVTWFVISSVLVASEANSQALLKPVAAARVNNAVARVVQRRAARMGIAANDNVVNATLAGMGAAGTELAVAAGAALVLGTPIGWGGILLTGLAVGAVTYFATSNGTPSMTITNRGDGTVEGEPAKPKFPSLYFYQGVEFGPQQKDQGIFQVTGGYGSIPLTPLENKSIQFNSWNGQNTQYNNPVDSGMVRIVGCAGSDLTAYTYCVLHATNKAIKELFPNQNLPLWEYERSDTVLDWEQKPVERIFIRRPAWKNPATGYVYAPISRELITGPPGNNNDWTQANNAIKIEQDNCSEGTCKVAYNEGSGWIPVVPYEAFVPHVGDAWYYFDSIPASQGAADLSPSQVAALANRLWQNAAAKPDYHGLPYSINDPITSADADAVRRAEPAAWPQVADLADPIAHAGTAPEPITFPDNAHLPADDPAQVPDPTTSPGTSPGTDLGGDPGIGQPDLGTAPTWKEIVDPLFTWFPAIGALEIPGGTCPTDSFEWNGQTFTLDQHCALLEDWRNVIGAAMMAVWTMAACVVLLRA